MTILGSLFTVCLIMLKNIFIKKYGGVWYYYIWTFVLFCYCFPYKIDIFQYFHKTIQYQQQNINHETILNDIPLHLENTTLLELKQNSEYSIYHVISAKQIIYCIYIIGFFACFSYYICHYIRFQRVLKNTTEVTSQQYIHCIKTVCSKMNINKTVILKKSTLPISPISVGIWKPIIILPDIDFTMEDFTMILKHELTHYKRKDILYRWFALFIHIIHWFNPISYFALCTIQEACEYSCDETVTKNMDIDSKIKYGNMLLNQIQHSKKRSLFFSSFSENCKNKNILRRRIDVIKNEKKYKRVMITLFCMFAVILCSNFFDFYTINANQKNNTTNENKQQYQNNSIHTINQHFAKTLTEHQLKVIYKFVDDFNTNVDITTRDLTDFEQQRLKLLREQYIYYGIRPQKELPLEEGTQEFYIDFNNKIYHYPERELTEEELLQLVEWRLKVNYALSLRYKESIPAFAITSSNDITQQKAIDIAKQNIENLFDIDTSELQINATFYQNSDIQPDGWFIRLYPKGDMPHELNWNYAVWISQTDNIEISRSSQNYQLQQTKIINTENKQQILQDKIWINKAKSIVEQKQDKINIVSANFINIDDSKKTTVDIKVAIADGSYYIVSLYYPDQSLKGITYIVS
nr:M56 family metallopeptidase [Clostridium sp. MD294]